MNDLLQKETKNGKEIIKSLLITERYGEQTELNIGHEVKVRIFSNYSKLNREKLDEYSGYLNTEIIKGELMEINELDEITLLIGKNKKENIEIPHYAIDWLEIVPAPEQSVKNVIDKEDENNVFETMKINFYLEDGSGFKCGDSINVHKYIEHMEIAKAFELWKDNWLVDNHKTKFQLINSYWEIEKEKDKRAPQWKTIEQCVKNHCKIISKYVSCDHFGMTDELDISCRVCEEMTPYQFHMCSDLNWEFALMLKEGYTQGEAIDFIQASKNKN